MNVPAANAPEVGLSRREVGHFESGTHFEQPPAMRALEAAMLPVVVVGEALAADPTFRRCAAEVAESPHKAHDIAIGYCKRGAGKRAIEAMLLEASRDLRPAVMATRLMNMGTRRAVFIEALPEPGDRRNAVQSRTVATFKLGAELLVRRGSGRCFTCWAYLPRADRGDYCEVHWPKWEGERGSDKNALRETLRAVAEHLAIPTDGPASRRRRRSAC